MALQFDIEMYSGSDGSGNTPATMIWPIQDVSGLSQRFLRIDKESTPPDKQNRHQKLMACSNSTQKQGGTTF